MSYIFIWRKSIKIVLPLFCLLISSNFVLAQQRAFPGAEWYGFNPKNASDRNGDRDKDGYTNLEEYLNSLVYSDAKR